MSPSRLIARFLGIVWALALAAFGLGLAVYCLDGLVGLGKARPDRLLGLVTVRKETGRFLSQLQAPGHVALLSLLCGLGAVLVGLVLARGVLTRPRERLALLAEDERGRLGARRRPLAQMLSALAGEPPGVLQVSRLKLSVKRRGSGGRVRLRTIRDGESDQAAVEESLGRALEPIASPFMLRTRIRTRLPQAARGRREARGRVS